jgi:DNA-binding transcriptional LysR family regulator
MLVDLVQLRTFIVVAESLHLTRAAERLHVSQSTASSHIRAIEDALDVQLFVRTNRSMELTRAGQLLLQKAKTLLNDAAEFTSYAREVRGKLEGNVMVGISGEPSASRLGDIVSALREASPLVTMDLRGLPSLGVRQALKTGELDVGMFLCRPIDPAFTYYQLATVSFRIAGPAAWKDKIEAADWTDLARLPWITPNDASLAASSMLGHLFGAKGLELNAVVRFDRAAHGHLLVQAGVGMILMREEEALQYERDGLVALSPIARSKLPLVVAHMVGREHCPLVGAFINAVKAAWPETVPVQASPSGAVPL